MQILCAKSEWSIFEGLLIEQYNISTVYNFPKFMSIVYAIGSSDELFRIEGEFEEENEG